MKRIFTHLFVAVLLMLSTTSWAQTVLEAGKIYHFQNAHFTGRAITANEGTNTAVQAAATNPADLKQQWYVSKDGERYIFRNMYNGYYLSQTAQNAWGLTETCTANSNKFEYIKAGGTNNTIRSTSVSANDNAYMHLGSVGQTNIQGWGSGSGGTQWTVTNVTYTDEHDAILGQFAESASTETISAALGAIFSDGACSVLKDAYTSANMTNEKLYADVNYQALPTALRKMVKKVRGGDWAEANAVSSKDSWNSEYAKKFRVQMYEPYSIEGEITSYLRINAHANMDNPTGIYATAGQRIYVMVEADEIPDGAELWLTYQTGSGNTYSYGATEYNSKYTQLQPGLNVITYTDEISQLWVNYLVHTYNENGTTIADKFPHKISDYEPLKIHIEGGYINGYYNAMGDFRAKTPEENLWGDVDNDDDWAYYRTRVPLDGADGRPNRDFPILGHRQTLLIFFGEAESGAGISTRLDEVVSNNVAVYDENGVLTGYKKTVPEKPFNNSGLWSDYTNMGLNTDNGKINIMIEAWDRIMYSELASMGLVSEAAMNKMNEMYPRWTAAGAKAEIYDFTNVSSIDGKNYKDFCQGLDYSEYFNHHGTGRASTTGYMSGGWRNCDYNYNTLQSIISLIAAEAGPTWGPAHEIGHQHQAVFNLNGQTEVTNNFFSNVAVWYMGMGTSRVNGSEGSLESVLAAFNTEGNDLYTNNIWAITHLYYRLWLYYHLAGNNTQFWPRLFELCRQEPLINGGQISGETSLLRFYQHACNAAGEDLTEFFRAHGFFEIMDNRLVGDYSNATYNVTQEQIDAAIAAVKAKSYPVNYAVLLINDGTSATTKKHDGSTSRSLWDNNPTAEFGSVNDFIDGDVEVLTNYTATLNSDGTITMSGGQGGVGFLVFNEKGELIAFSNKATFKLSDEALEAIVSGKATITTVDTESNVTTAEVDITAMQRTVLEQLIAKAQPIVDKIDNTYTKIGYFKGAAVADLASALAYAREVCEGSSGYEAAYDLLYAEYTKVLAIPDLKIALDLNKKYIISNNAYTTRNIVVDGVTVRALENNTAAAQWSFVSTGTAGSYYLKNAEGYYCPAVVTGDTGGNVTTEQASAGVYTLKELENGLWAIVGKNASMHASASQSYNIVGWSYDATASQWYITATETDENIANLTELQVLVAKTETLLNEVVGAVTYTKGTPLSLQTTTQNSAGYLWSNAPSTAEGSIANLVDGATNNHFHTDYTSEPPSGSHYLAVYLGEDKTLSSFTFSHTTRSGASADFPKSVDVYGSDDNVTYKYIGSASGMPQSAGTAWEFGGVMQSSYKYLRFNYHANRGYWHMAEFDITPVTGFTATVNDTYSGTVRVDAVTAAMNALHNGKRTANSISPATGDVKAKLEALQSAYETLYGQYEATIDARKTALAQLAAETETLINEVGSVKFTKEEKSLNLTIDNFYCNDPHLASGSDYSADYVDKLTDGKTGTFLHTDYSNSNPDGTTPHYLRIDLGENSSATGFKFTYTTRDNGNDCPTEIVVAGCNVAEGEYHTICTLRETDAVNPLPNGASEVYISSEISRPTTYRYIRLIVTKTENRTNSYFVISEFSFTTVENKVETTVNDAYKKYVTDEMLLTTVLVTNSSKAMSANELVTSVPFLDAQIADQQAAYDAFHAAIDVTSELKAELQMLHDEVVQFYLEIADENNGVIEEYYRTAFTQDDLYALAAAIQNAERVYAVDYTATVEEITAAYEGLNAEYERLMEIKTADVADRSSLQALIDEMQGLLDEMTDGISVPAAITLQATDANAPFYIWCNAPAGDSQGVAGLIDKNNTGTANTGTFLGTAWGSEVPAYTHYIEIDMGMNVIEDLLIDYTTRDSESYGNQRPNGLKILGSKDKEVYEEIMTITEGLPTGQCEKWTMATPVEFTKNYRYIRVAVSTEVGYFNLSDFNLYSNSMAAVNGKYSTSDIFDCLPAVLSGYAKAKNFMTVYLSATLLEDAKTALQEHIATLNAIKNANVIDRNSLEDLITQTNTLIKEVATVSEEEAAIAMQCTDVNAPYYLYCNADGTITNGDGDRAGVAALVGDNATNSTHLHTTYNNKAQDDDLDHYLRLDMGENEAMVSFKFRYTGRINNVNNAPTKMLIEGSNDLENFDEIATLDIDVPESGTATYSTEDALGNGKAYRYIRFMVKDTKNHASNNGHPFFVLSQFAVTACKTIEVAGEYASPNLPLSTVIAANNEAVDGTTVKEQFYVTETVYNTAIAELQAAKGALEAAMLLKNIPVKLTTDVNNPVLYKIKINRDGDKRLQYDAESAMVAVADENVGNKAQAWFFMSGADATKDVLILPYTGEGKVLATNSFSVGDSKVQVVESTADGYSNNWNVVAIENSEWSNISILNGSGATYYFSNHGGVDKKMGFYNTNPSTDGGSMFQFVLDETDYSLSDAYYALYNQYVACGGEAASGTVIGTYTVESAIPYNTAYNNAAALLEAKNSTDDEYDDARTTLAGAHDALEYNGGLCRIRSAYTGGGGYSSNKLAYVDAENKPHFEAADDEDLSKYVWEFVPVLGGYHLKSLHTQSYVTAASWGTQVVLGDEAAARLVTVDFLDNENGIVRLNVAGGYPLHAQADGSKLVGYKGGLGTASAWYVEEIEDVTTIKHTVTMSATFSSVMLGYNATVPAGVEAYNAEGVEDGYVTLVELEGGVIPANTPVILYRTDDNTSKTFTYTTTDANTPTETVLGGSLYQKFVKCDDDKDYYKLMIKGGEAKMYWMYKEFNAAGVSQGSTNDGGHIKCSANKIYMALPQREQAASFGMRFKEPETTGAQEVKTENGEVKTIYDLQGRKLTEITEPGFYIVNGKKVYVK